MAISFTPPADYDYLAEQAKRRAAALADQAVAAERLALTAQAIARALPEVSEGKVARAAQWLCQWLPEAAWGAFSYSPYPIADDIRETLTAYRITLTEEV